MDSEAEALVRSIDNCIAVLQGNLSQPGSSAIFLKLEASWQDLKASIDISKLCEIKKENDNILFCLQKAKHEQISAERSSSGQKEEIKQLSRESMAIKDESNTLSSDNSNTQLATFKDEDTDIIISDLITQPDPVISETVVSKSENGVGVTSEPSTTIQSSATDSEVLSITTASTGISASISADSLGEEYQKVDFPVLYYHRTTGYYYDPSSQQFLAPCYGNSSGQELQGQVGEAKVDGSGGETHSSMSVDQGYYSVTSQPGSSGQVNQSAGQASGSSSIADILAATSDRATERCGYQYHEGLDMFYDANIGLYYHQESKLYYDADLGCYYHYDYDNKEYTLHSRVRLPDQEEGDKRRRKPKEDYISSDEEFIDSPEEGEIRLPHIPRGSPPPEEDWDPCIRALVSESETLPKGTLFVITQDGANIGREPTGTNCLIKIPELKVSKLHAVLSYDKHEKSFVVRDLGSVNGTYLNKDQRLSEPRTSSQPCPLVHGHTLTLGSTTLTLHIHTGWETCSWCDPSRGAWLNSKTLDAGAQENEEELDLQRRKELNRIKKKYGLRVKDTYGQDEVVVNEGYKDRSMARRKVVGSDVPESQRPDDVPSSVHKPIADSNKGHRMLEKMGWKMGEGLGREGRGTSEPVKSEVRSRAKSGLGSRDTLLSLDTAWDENSSIAKSQRMRRRFDEASKSDLVKKRKTNH